MRLTNRFIRKKVKELARQTATRRNHFCSLKDARHTLVLFNAEDREEVEPCLEALRKLNKNMNVYVYVSSDAVPEMNPSYGIIHVKTDLDMWYMPTGETLKRFCACGADILIDLTRGNNYAMQYLLLKHPGSFKVGVKNSGADLYDLTISVTEDTDIKHLFDHILFYLQTIRSK